jgi:hypothetical protein
MLEDLSDFNFAFFEILTKFATKHCCKENKCKTVHVWLNILEQNCWSLRSLVLLICLFQHLCFKLLLFDITSVGVAPSPVDNGGSSSPTNSIQAIYA